MDSPSPPWWYLTRDELSAMAYEWIPDSCPVLAALCEAVEADKNVIGARVFIVRAETQRRPCGSV